jgi:hypothetical protein
MMAAIVKRFLETMRLRLLEGDSKDLAIERIGYFLDVHVAVQFGVRLLREPKDERREAR